MHDICRHTAAGLIGGRVMRIGAVFLTVLLVAALSGCDESGASAESSKESAWNYASQKAVRAKLKDPKSAEFSEVYFSRRGGLPMTCGHVNAKNSFGGYAGAQRFISAGGEMTYLEDEVEGFDKLWNRMC
jgi:hypothetical protein